MSVRQVNPSWISESSGFFPSTSSALDQIARLADQVRHPHRSSRKKPVNSDSPTQVAFIAQMGLQTPASDLSIDTPPITRGAKRGFHATPIGGQASLTPLSEDSLSGVRRASKRLAAQRQRAQSLSPSGGLQTPASIFTAPPSLSAGDLSMEGDKLDLDSERLDGGRMESQDENDRLASLGATDFRELRAQLLAESLKKEDSASLTPAGVLMQKQAQASIPLSAGPSTESGWTPNSKKQLTQAVKQITPNRYRVVVGVAQEEALKSQIPVPHATYLDQLRAFGASWEEVVEMFINATPHRFIRRREDARELKSELLQEGSVDFHHCVTQMRVKHLDVAAEPCKGAWSPGVGTLSKFALFIREKFRVTEGRNIALALARTREGRLIYTVAVTDGPAGGDHAELLAWDAMPKEVKEQKRGLIYTELEPCTRGSRCSIKVKQILGEDCHIIFTRPIIGQEATHCRYVDRASATGLLGRSLARSLLPEMNKGPAKTAAAAASTLPLQEKPQPDTVSESCA